MRILALETSSLLGSVAALNDDQLVLEVFLQPSMRTAQSLAPGIRQCLCDAGWNGQDVDAVATTHGPGSFTGLRLGVTTAKTLSYVWESRLIGINTLAAIAAQAPDNVRSVVPALDAYRQQTFSAAFFRDEHGAWREQMPTCLVDDAQWVNWVPSGAAVTGFGVQKFLGDALGDMYVIEQSRWQPRAATVGRLAYAELLAGRSDDVWQFVPRYFRQSAAEEKQNQTGR